MALRHRLYQFHQDAVGRFGVHKSYVHSVRTGARLFVNKFDPFFLQFGNGLLYIIHLKSYMVYTFAVVVQKLLDGGLTGNVLQQLYRAVSHGYETDFHSLIVLSMNKIERQCSCKQLESGIQVFHHYA